MPCYIRKNGDGSMFLCGNLGPHCVDCADSSDFLCDYPVGEGKTCDAALCPEHAQEVAPEIHYCSGHMVMWNEFRAGGGVERELSNVVPFKVTP